ncbi:MAG TPA: hypothetical protein VMR41_06055 [Patescibacteria group bacterium]|nr:hypothetical protein [Patescibacteria group bacterium]
MKLLQRILTSSRTRFILSLFLIIGICWNVGSTVYSQGGKYITHNYWQRFPSLKQTYLNSQYVNKHATGFIPDEVAASYTGGAFIQGANPLYIVPDAPPLGKYLIGLSILLFQNENIITLTCAILSLILLYLLGKQIFSSTVLALIPVFLFSCEALFKNQLVYTPLFDLMQLVFLLGGFLLFNKGLVEKKKYIYFFALSSLLLGCFIATKFFMSGLTIIAAWYVLLFLKKDKKRIISLTAVLPLAPIVLLSSYFRAFAYGYNLRQIIGAQKWIFDYHQSQLINPFSIWPLLLFNQWYTWWGNIPILHDAQWNLMWPIITILSIITAVFYILRKIPYNMYIEILMIWAICYLLFFSVGQITTRYFVILLPVLYIVALYGVKEFIIKYKFFKIKP